MTAASSPAQRLVVIVHGEISPDAPADELDTLVQVEAVSNALSKLGYQVTPVSVGLDLSSLRQRLVALQPQSVFNLVETVGGMMRLTPCAPMLIEALGIPHTGCSAEALAVTTDKCLTKERLLQASLRTPAWWDGRRPSVYGLSYPATAIVKSVHEDGSIGLVDDSVQQFADEVSVSRAAKEAALKFGGVWFAEEYIEGREFNVAILERCGEPVLLPLAEIEFKDFPPGKPRIVGYRAKWDDVSFEATHTVHRTQFSADDRALTEEVGAVALRCWRLFGLRGYARVDIRVSDRGIPFVIEINANPCISPDAGFTKAAARAGLSYEDMIAEIIGAAHAN